jgi:hypothetical protein
MKKQQQKTFLGLAVKDLDGAKSAESYKAKILALFTVGVKAADMIAALETLPNGDVLKARFHVVRAKLKVTDKAAALESAVELDSAATHESVFGMKERTAPAAASEKSADVRKTAKAACALLVDGGVNKSLAGLCAQIVATFEAYPLETSLPDIFIKVGDCLRTGAMRNDWDAAKTTAKDKVKAIKDEVKAAFDSKGTRKLATKSQIAKAKGKKQKVTS